MLSANRIFGGLVKKGKIIFYLTIAVETNPF